MQKYLYAIRRYMASKILLQCGDNVVIKDRCYFGDGSKLKVGSNSQLGQNSRLQGKITLGDNVMMGPDVIIMAITHDVSRNDIPMNTPNLPIIENQ